MFRENITTTRTIETLGHTIVPVVFEEGEIKLAFQGFEARFSIDALRSMVNAHGNAFPQVIKRGG